MISTDRLLELVSGTRPAVVLTVLDGPQVGAKCAVLLDTSGPETEGADIDGLSDLVARARLITRSTVLEHDGVRVLADVHGLQIRLVVVGAYDVTEELCAMGRRLGWRSIVIDARERFATRERLPSADEIVVAWPEEGLREVALDTSTGVVVLTHDQKFDVPALRAALMSDAFYVGALGSRKNQERRRPRLLEAGVPEGDIERIDGPAGLDIGGESPAETAISIAAQIIARRNGRTGGPLGRATGRIHGSPDDERPGEGSCATGPGLLSQPVAAWDAR